MSGPPHLFEVTVLAEWTDYHVRGVIDTAELRVQHYRALVRHIQDENLQSGYSFWIEGHFGHLVVDDETLHATVDDAKLAAVEALGRQMRQDSHQHRMKYIEEVSKAAGMPPMLLDFFDKPIYPPRCSWCRQLLDACRTNPCVGRKAEAR